MSRSLADPSDRKLGRTEWVAAPQQAAGRRRRSARERSGQERRTRGHGRERGRHAESRRSERGYLPSPRKWYVYAPPARGSNTQISPYFNPTYTRTGWIGQPPVLDRLEVVTIDKRRAGAH